MANIELYYRRVRGVVDGPYDVPTLHGMVKRGTFSRIHHVSLDRVNWETAGRLEHLFPQPEPVKPPEPPPPPPPPPNPPSHGGLCYDADGQTAGPVPVAVIESLIINGAVRPDTRVWSPEDGQKIAAKDHPLLRNSTFPESDPTDPTTAPRRGRFMSTRAMILSAVCLSVVALGGYGAYRLTAKPAEEPTPPPAVPAPQAPAVAPTAAVNHPPVAVERHRK